MLLKIDVCPMPTLIDAVDAEPVSMRKALVQLRWPRHQASSIKHLGALYVRLIKAIQVLQEFAVFSAK